MLCYLHIGTEKTGSTTLQYFFKKNKRALKKQGVLYIDEFDKNNHGVLAVCCYSDTRHDELSKFLRVAGDNDEKYRLAEKVKKIYKKFDRNNNFKLIISSEHLHARLTTVSEIKRLKKLLKDIGIDDVRIVVYLREPVYAAQSLYSTAIKSGSTIDSPPFPVNEYWDNLCNHKNTIKRWSGVFGSDNVIVRLFDKGDFVGGTIISDFAYLIGYDVSDLMMDFRSDLNKSLSVLGAEVLKGLNYKIPAYIHDKKNPMRFGLVNYINEKYQGDAYQMSFKLQEYYGNIYCESNEWVKDNYFPLKDQLFEKKNIINKSADILCDKQVIQEMVDFEYHYWSSSLLIQILSFIGEYFPFLSKYDVFDKAKKLLKMMQKFSK